MDLRSHLLIALLGAVLMAPGAHAQSSGDPVGMWQTQAGDARVRVTRCGGGICGVIASLRDKVDPQTGRPPVDDKNPDPAKRGRSMVGVSLFIDMKSTGPAGWSGQIYNSDDGKVYSSNVSMAGADAMKVEGCLGAFCGGETWTRVGR
jgi:uncharacterized protein (DUF2147 family)